MRNAIIVSIILHSMALLLVFKQSQSKEQKYPTVMIVHLASPPPAKGIPEPAVPKAVSQTEIKPQKKTELVKEQTRVAEINKDKKPKRQKPEPKPKPAEVEETPTSDQQQNKGLPEGVSLGSEFGSARLDVAGFDSPYFLNVLFGKIRNQWDNPYEGQNGIQCTIYFVISRDGHIVDSVIETSSGIMSFDQSALRAVLNCRPPPLPGQFGAEELGIHLQFQYIPY